MARAERGEVWLVDLGYAAKTRPCLVLNVPTLDTDRALTTLIPCTTSARGTRFEVPVSTPFLGRSGVFDAQNPTSTTQAKLIRKLGSLTADQLEQVEDAVRHWLGL
ncbi:MAG: type II toxin-antitoxin system PemK/MazF family toxin [Paludisphaera borealis]|uniref:type II toxin-antitoxin system PemK/MazF family toxin n=1 Tax=Paludisphaera borealis TaxID=1387353 RepID=UPI002846C904|nr:type II toxin-antitoxin system PemK/MazF family toxin [Paludisphaera borealis]MDR3618513.1 type II toxin-antitoxin system PemK/MazF family toxin [Paludisphaera borealis]